MAQGDSFDLVGDGEIGVVCVHGFTGSPCDMRYLGDQLASAGFDVHGIRLPGHATSIADLDRTKWSDWTGAVEAAFDKLRKSCARVAVVGQSLGGLLALHLASRRTEVAGVASLAAPLWFEGLSGTVARWAAAGRLRRIRSLPKIGGSDIRDRRAIANFPGYSAIPVRALGELTAFMEIADAALPKVTQPVLVIHGEQDHTAPIACATRVAERTRAVRMRILRRSYHVISVDVEREIVAGEVLDFLRNYVQPPRASGDLACAT